jgi:hypothetical protein
MLRQLRDANIERIRQRVSEADCPVTPALSVETLETIVVELADDLARFEATTRATQPEAALREALEAIADPLTYLRKQAEAEGNQLSGMAYSIANDPEFLKGIARAALKDHRHG